MASETQVAKQGVASAQEIVRVVLIEDKREIREGLRVLIDGTPGYRCVGAFRSLEDALVCIAQLNPLVILLDIGLPGMSGIQGMLHLKERCPKAPVLILSVYEDDERIFGALCAGASGYLLKRTPPAQLLESLKEVSQGGAPMSPEVARRVIHLFREFRPPEKSDYNMTPHEIRLLQLLAEGHNYKTAAEELGVTVNTIAFHMKHIYEKLHVHSKSEAVAKALRNRIVR
jgi:DNA-binding NarL/FixJ family response regulator